MSQEPPFTADQAGGYGKIPLQRRGRTGDRRANRVPDRDPCPRAHTGGSSAYREEATAKTRVQRNTESCLARIGRTPTVARSLRGRQATTRCVAASTGLRTERVLGVGSPRPQQHGLE